MWTVTGGLGQVEDQKVWFKWVRLWLLAAITLKNITLGCCSHIQYRSSSLGPGLSKASFNLTLQSPYMGHCGYDQGRPVAVHGVMNSHSVTTRVRALYHVRRLMRGRAYMWREWLRATDLLSSWPQCLFSTPPQYMHVMSPVLYSSYQYWFSFNAKRDRTIFLVLRASVWLHKKQDDRTQMVLMLQYKTWCLLLSVYAFISDIHSNYTVKQY